MYSIPASRCHAEVTIKKSRFIACVDGVADREATKSLLQSVQDEYPDASHYCWAYVLGAPRSPLAVAASDDGEPSGTAGKPILNVLNHKQIGDVMIVVVRYFGGIRLGASGLVRAYSNAAQTVIDKLSLVELIDHQTFNLVVGFHQEQYLRHWLRQHQGVLVSLQYTDEVFCVINVPASCGEALEAASRAKGWRLLDATCQTQS